MEAEYGSSDNIRWLDPSCATLVDSNGNVVLCKCGKPAGAAAIGKSSMQVWCSDCYHKALHPIQD